MKVTIIGIAGGTASGKTTIADKVVKYAENMGTVAHIRIDDYYLNKDRIPLDEEGKRNYDHPDALDVDLIVKNLKDLENGIAIDKPKYDFVTSSRMEETEHVEPAQLIVVEGILAFAIKKLRRLFHIKLFVDTPDDIRFIRRLERDMLERGRSLESVITQYLSSVRPMHHAFVEPSKRYADLIIPDGGQNEVAMDFLYTKVEQIYKK